VNEALITELKRVVRGEVLTDEASLEHYATDGSIFRVKPWAVVLPKDERDISSLVKWLREKKETDPKNQKLSLTARGKATDQAGGPLNEGIIIRFPGYFDKILEIGRNFVRVEPGALFGAVNSELERRGRFLPFYPASQAFSTIGGAVANNAAGEKSVKYGSARLYIKSLKMILSTGAEVEITTLPYADLEQKKQQVNLEGDVYREVDEILRSEKKILEKTAPKTNKYSIGYNLWDVARITDEGRLFDLTQLIAGSQGTLGILTEVTLWTLPKPKYTGVLLSYYDTLPNAGQATAKLVALEPSALEMVDHFLLEIVKREKPEMLEGLLPATTHSGVPSGQAHSGVPSGQVPELALLCEFDGDDQAEIENKLTQAQAVIRGLAYEVRATTKPEEQTKLWQVRRSALPVIEEIKGKKRALPFIEDVAVPPERFPEYVSRLYEILQRHQVEFAIWGHAGNGNVHVQPFLDVGDEEDRKKLFGIADETFELAVELGGVLSGEHNDGIMRTPYLSKLYPPELLKIWQRVKKTFDPLNIFNPGKKFPMPWSQGGIDFAYMKSRIRDSYDVGPPKAKPPAKEDKQIS